MLNTRYSGKPLVGDWLIIILSIALVLTLFKTLWHVEQATKLLIRQGDHVFATLSLDQERMIRIQGPIGYSTIILSNGKVRFESSPCSNQYCVHQGWLNRVGQVAVCLPNQVSLELLGRQKSYDSLNY